MSETVYFFDHLQKLIKRKNKRSLIEVSQEKEISSDKSDLMKDTLYVTTKYDKEIEDARYMAIRENESSFSLYRIIKVSDPSETLEFTGLGFATNELDAYIVKDIRPSGQSLKNVLDRLIEFTEGNWRVGHVEAMLPTVTATFYYVSVKEALKELQTLGMEFVFRCSLNSDGIKDKWIEVYEQIGEESNTRFVYGSKALTVVREIDRSSISTSMIGRGRGEEVGDGYGRRIEFTDVEWKKSNGDPLDKPKGQNWLEDPEATQKYGIPQKDGSMRKRETVVVFDDIDDPTELLKNTYSTLIDSARPLVQFKAEVTGGDVIGNTVTIHRYDKGYHYKTRIYKTTFNRLTGQTNIELGDNLTQDVRKRTASIVNNINSLESSKMTFYESTEIGKYQDDIMRGAGDNGGSVYQVNGIEAGVSNSREVYETVYMDGPDIPNSQHFMIENSLGISFKSCTKGQWQNVKDVHDGPSDTAWTLDGVFNAKFIRTGVIRSNIFETSFNNYGEQLKLVGGALRVLDGEKKIMELTKKGMEFWNTMESIGTIGTTDSAGNPFPGASTPTPLEENSIVIRTNGDGKFILISPTTGKGFVMLGNGKTIHFGDLDVQGKLTGVSGSIAGRLDVEELYVNGVKIDTNGGNNTGGNDNGWNGQYPPEVTTDRDKRYWQIWAMAIGAGFTKQAAAALLGNAQGESDANPTADEGNGAPGFGYGVWQWTDSSGATSGRVYMINLMTKAGISDDPDTITAQFKLLMWHAPNGQWIATSAYPYTWTQFMNLTDINTAAQAFVANFERPRDPHPERTTWAQEWYDKFKDLEITASKGYIKPIADPITVTSEFGWRTSPITGAQEFHNGIDLVNGNPNTPIFASADGEVIVAGDANYYDWYGNWTVIQHADGMYTGYAHQSRVDVSKGQKVTAGQQIGLMGTTGPSTGEHLHFQFMDEFYPSSSGHFHNARDYIDF
ncbi:phage tail spike protein [Enterococcus durans]|uniref:phage tail spike protein n=1 Tax=Enterococcus durans TaxID=53345 RepID=UPI00115B27CB|nr:phage tail spike protein [Enterococcus durans]